MPSKELKLYYWDELLRGQAPIFLRRGASLSCAFALASSKEHAVELIIDDAKDSGGISDQELESLRAELIAKRAHIHYNPVGFVRPA